MKECLLLEAREILTFFHYFIFSLFHSFHYFIFSFLSFLQQFIDALQVVERVVNIEAKLRNNAQLVTHLVA